VSENAHPLNVLEVPDDFVAAVEQVARPPLYEVYMRMAEELAKRSTCTRLQVGTVVTNASLEHVVSIGYNGNARGFPNRCDSTEEGRCGCIHSEMNALVKAPGDLRDKVAFVTASPCVMCAKLMVQANVSHVFYRRAYRDPSGVEILERGGVRTVLYTRWKDAWRD
jgi:dCMP deaminase